MLGSNLPEFLLHSKVKAKPPNSFPSSSWSAASASFSASYSTKAYERLNLMKHFPNLSNSFYRSRSSTFLDMFPTKRLILFYIKGKILEKIIAN